MNRDEDWEFILNFCDRVNFELEGPQIACRLIGHKIQSPQEREAMQALIVAEACVKNCGEGFHREVGKFRFLNELIKLISPKYLGNRTSEKVKKKTIEIMYSWQKGLPHETKIKEAYDMLKKQGLVKEDPVYVDETFKVEPATPRMAEFEDEDKAKLLSRLLKSKHAEDLQAANRLIKNMVKEEEKKTEKITKRMNDLESCNNNVKLLNDMLTHYDPQVTSEGELDLMKELFQTCERMRPNLFRLASDADEKDDGIADILQTNDALVKVMEDYKAKFGDPKTSASDVPTAEEATPSSSGPQKSSLIDLGGGSPVKSAPTTNGTDQRPPASRETAAESASAISNDLSLLDLNTSSSSATSSGNSSVLQRTNPSDLDNLLGASPVSNSVANVHAINAAAAPPNIPFSQPSQTVRAAYPGLPQSGMGAYPYQANQPHPQTVMQPGGGMFGVQQHVVPMNMGPQRPPMQMPRSQPMNSMNVMGSSSISGISSGQTVAQPSKPAKPEPKKPVDTFADLANLGKSMVTQPKPSTTTEIPSSETQNAIPPQTQVAPPPVATQTTIPLVAGQPAKPTNPPVLSLADVFVSLESVQPGELQPVTAYEKNSVKTVIHFGKDTPRPDVRVMVVSTMSTNATPVKNLTFQAAVPKTMRVKLQPPSATDLPAFNPILPPSAITQVMLLANPQKEKVRLKFKLQYQLGDQNIMDIGEISAIPS